MQASLGPFFFTVPKKGYSADEDPDEQHVFLPEDTLFKITKFVDSNFLVFTDKMFSKKPKQYTDTLYPMQWHLESDKKIIDTLECYKATTFFKGRNYIAWYCPAISIPNGPWKLGGLPGLIIEAYDENRDMRFLLSHLKVVLSSQILDKVLRPPDFNKIYTYPQYVRNGLAFLKRMKEQIRTQSEGNCLDCHTNTKVELHNWENVIIEPEK